jgi:hypothetical protein
MKHLFTSTIITSGLLVFASTSYAALFDFQAWITANGEQGFNNSSPFTLTDSGLTLTATAFESPGMIDSHVYMDDVFNGIVGGMGVCTTLSGNQCSPSSDDNVSIDGSKQEILTWNFTQNIASLTLDLGNNDHFDYINNDFQYSFGGSGWLTATTDSNAMATLLLTGGTGQINFRASGNTLGDHFYIRNADITVVPVPAAIWLFGSGLIGLAGLAKRKV